MNALAAAVSDSVAKAKGHTYNKKQKKKTHALKITKIGGPKAGNHVMLAMNARRLT